MDILRTFNGDIHTKEALKEFMFDCMNEETLERVLNRKDVSHIADAWELINKSFDKLELMYGIQTQKSESTNQAK